MRHLRLAGHDDALVWTRFDGKNWRAETIELDGLAFGAATLQTVSPPGDDALEPGLVDSPPRAVWRSYDGSHWRVRSSRFRYGSGTWSPPVYISPAGSDAESLSVARVGFGGAVVAWRADDGVRGLIATRTTFEGSPWTPIAFLSDVGNDASAPVTDGEEGWSYSGSVAWIETEGAATSARAATFLPDGTVTVETLSREGASVSSLTVENGFFTGPGVAWVEGTSPAMTVKLRGRDAIAPDTRMRGLPVVEHDGDAVVAWRSIDDWSAVTGYDVRLRLRGWRAAVWTTKSWLTDTADHSRTRPLRPGRTYCFAARARDALGRQGGWAWPSCTTTPVDDRTFTRHGGWRAKTGPGRYLASYLQTGRRGAMLTLPKIISARRIDVLAEKGPGYGRIRVTFGRWARTIDLASAESQRMVRVSVCDGGCGKGRVKIETLSRGQTVRIDGLAVIREPRFKK